MLFAPVAMICSFSPFRNLTEPYHNFSFSHFAVALMWASDAFFFSSI